MIKPWEDPDATGYGRMVSTEEYTGFVDSTVASFEQRPKTIMGLGPYASAIIDFARRHSMWIKRDELKGDREIWALVLEHERMDRWVCVNVRRADWFNGWHMEVRTYAAWAAGPSNSYLTVTERRWFGLTNRSPVELLGETLELALVDAKGYRVDELCPRAEANSSSRPWFE